MAQPAIEEAVASPAIASERGPAVGIREACASTGLSARTVRYWEELGLLPGIRRRQGGRRVYGPDELERMRFIQRLKTLGLSLAEIKELNAVYAIAGSTGDMLQYLDQLLGRRLEELDDRIDELVSLRDEMCRYRTRIADRGVVVQSGAGPATTRDPVHGEPVHEEPFHEEPLHEEDR